MVKVWSIFILNINVFFVNYKDLNIIIVKEWNNIGMCKLIGCVLWFNWKFFYWKLGLLWVFLFVF